MPSVFSSNNSKHDMRINYGTFLLRKIGASYHSKNDRVRIVHSLRLPAPRRFRNMRKNFMKKCERRKFWRKYCAKYFTKWRNFCATFFKCAQLLIIKPFIFTQVGSATLSIADYRQDCYPSSVCGEQYERSINRSGCTIDCFVSKSICIGIVCT